MGISKGALALFTLLSSGSAAAQPPAQPPLADANYEHVDVSGSILVSYSNIDAVPTIEQKAQARGAEFKGAKHFHRPQRKKSKKGGAAGGRSLLDEEEAVAGWAAIVVPEGSSVAEVMTDLGTIPGVSVEQDSEVHIDSLRGRGTQADDSSSGRHLQDSTPWGIHLVNVTELWEVSSYLFIAL